MTVNSGIEACIRDRRLSQIPGLIQIGAKDGMHTVDESLIELLLANRISLMDALAHARDPEFCEGALPASFADPEKRLVCRNSWQMKCLRGDERAPKAMLFDKVKVFCIQDVTRSTFSEKNVYTTPASHKTLLKHIDSACAMIALRWETIPLEVDSDESGAAESELVVGSE
jgi:hypothetical protein